MTAPTSRDAARLAPANADLRALNEHLRAICHGVSLVASRPPLLEDLPLWLMNADYPVGRLSNDAVRALLDDPPYWAFCWGSGAVLSRWLLDRPAIVRGRTVLDFGAGSGVVAIAAARAGAGRVVAADRDARALAACRANAALNAVDVETRDDGFSIDGTIDVLLAADVLYDADNMPLLQRFRSLARTVLVADSRVRNLDASGYEKVWEEACRVEPDLVEDESVRVVRIYRAGGFE